MSPLYACRRTSWYELEITGLAIRFGWPFINGNNTLQNGDLKSAGTRPVKHWTSDRIILAVAIMSLPAVITG